MTDDSDENLSAWAERGLDMGISPELITLATLTVYAEQLRTGRKTDPDITYLLYPFDLFAACAVQDPARARARHFLVKGAAYHARKGARRLGQALEYCLTYINDRTNPKT